MKKVLLILALVLVIALTFTACGPKTEEPVVEEAVVEETMEKASISIESWRNDDLPLWNDVIIPAFNAHYPDIEVTFAPSPPAEYNGILSAKLEGGTAGDLITARPFDNSLDLYTAGYLADLTDLSGMENFGDAARSAWITDDGSAVFAVPMASVIHGFMYNKDAFAELGLEVPETRDEFYAVLDAFAADGNYTSSLAMGTNDLWDPATMGFQNVGPNFWGGEAGRVGLIEGTEKFTDQQYVDTFAELAAWAPYLASGYEAQTYPDSQNMFMLGLSPIYPTGSWEIGVFGPNVDFEMGAFKPYVMNEGDTCYISDHTDIALGLNAASANTEAAKTFLEWMTTAEFADIYTNNVTGFFTLSNHTVEVTNPVAAEILSWRGECESTIRNSYQILSRGEPNLENELWRLSAAVMNLTLTPEEAAAEVQAGLEAWYAPQQ